MAELSDILSGLRLSMPAFPPRRWSADQRAALIAVEVLTSSWQTVLLEQPPDSGLELDVVLARAAERPARTGELTDQAQTLLPFFMSLLSITHVSHPATCTILHACETIAALTSPWFKQKWRRPRPSQLMPAILPAMPVPGSPSYPQQHATAAFLIALSLKRIIGVSDVGVGEALDSVAEHAADNRVIAGVSFPSDVDGARQLARGLFPRMLEASPNYEEMLFAAQFEWQDTTWAAPQTRPQTFDELVARYQQAGNKWLLVIEADPDKPFPDRALTVADFDAGLRYLHDLVLHGIAISDALDDLASPDARQDAGAGTQAFAVALARLQSEAPGQPTFDPLAELELVAMGVGSAWLEAVAKRARDAMVALALGTGTVAGSVVTIHGISALERAYTRQLIVEHLDKCLLEPKVPVSIKRECQLGAYASLDKTQSSADLEEKGIRAIVLPGDEAGRRSVRAPEKPAVPVPHPARR